MSTEDLIFKLWREHAKIMPNGEYFALIQHMRQRELRRMPEVELHQMRSHPDYEYATTEGPRKAWDDEDVPPYDDNGEPDPSWERNVDAGDRGWERFDYTEEAYWRRRRGTGRPLGN
jgi:hypothetical protein